MPIPLTAPFDEIVTSCMLSEGSGQSYHLDATRFRLEHKEWRGEINGLVNEAKRTLGLNGVVKAVPYHLIVSNEKAPLLKVPELPVDPNRFGMLQVQLPSIYTGGKTTWSILEEEKRIEPEQSFVMAPGSGRKECELLSTAKSCAYLSELQREDSPLTSSTRVLILYGLVSETPVPTLLDRLEKSKAFDELVAEYAGEEIIYPLKSSHSSGISGGMTDLDGTDQVLARQLYHASMKAKKKDDKPLMMLFLSHWTKCVDFVRYKDGGDPPDWDKSTSEHCYTVDPRIDRERV